MRDHRFVTKCSVTATAHPYALVRMEGTRAATGAADYTRCPGRDRLAQLRPERREAKTVETRRILAEKHMALSARRSALGSCGTALLDTAEAGSSTLGVYVVVALLTGARTEELRALSSAHVTL